MRSNEDLQGRLSSFLARQLGTDVVVSDWHNYAAGFSWLTYGFRLQAGADSSDLILRLAPRAGILPVYRAKPEAEALRLIGSSAIPVPRVLWYSDDPALFGTSFLICTKCPGKLPLPSQKVDAQEAATLRELAEEFMVNLARLHAVDWRDSTFSTLFDGRDEDNATRKEVEYWSAMIEQSAQRPQPILEWSRRWLMVNAPRAQKISVVHGEYRIGNFLAEGSTITGILDWETVHIGDPLEDIGWAFQNDWNGKSGRLFGIMERSEAFDIYESAGGVHVDPGSLPYFDVMSRYKLAAISLQCLDVFLTGKTTDLRVGLVGSQCARTIRELTRIMENL